MPPRAILDTLFPCFVPRYQVSQEAETVRFTVFRVNFTRRTCSFRKMFYRIAKPNTLHRKVVHPGTADNRCRRAKSFAPGGDKCIHESPSPLLSFRAQSPGAPQLYPTVARNL